ncbi:4a-hydroxytetrahydrobiopterin dehydratase [Agarivorans sp. QJM3NY_25]
MNTVKPLSKPAIIVGLKNLPNWQYKEGFISKDYQFKNFIEAFEFMSRVANYAEQQQHHPNWSNTYNRVNIRLTTHECKGVSDRDFKLAKLIEQLFTQYY